MWPGWTFSKPGVEPTNHLGHAPPNPARIATYCLPPAAKVIGGALTPVLVSNDHNSLRLSDKSGIILCDDVYINRNQDISDEMYKSNATYETLNVLKKQNLIDYRLIYKRIRPEYNCIENEKKYIAFCNKKWLD